ncbi:hypothetical protein WwSim0041 [Wolbachia endosymbiont of Drosophila simulans]|nr:hypothetical protein WwSim0041 [Wolbachia endosymbiont of Drosophila simulans]
MPDKTAATVKFLFLMPSSISLLSGPEFPMQVVQPYPTRLKPKAFRSTCNPDFSKYSVTTCDPGAREVLTQGFDFNPSLIALRATRPAAIITLGFEVLVQLVIAAITTLPSWSLSLSFDSLTENDLEKDSATCERKTLSCGLLGPAITGFTLDKSSSSASKNANSSLLRHSPCSFA